MAERAGMGRTTVNSQKKQVSRWFGVLFGLVFFSVGAGFLVFSVVPNLWDVTRMQDWVPVQAEVVAAELETGSSDGGTTYRVTASFRYNYKGQHYTGNRVGIADSGRDNVGDWHQVTYGKLNGRRHAMLWVNPADPSESVFDREMRWGLLGFKMIFVIVFGGAGAVIMWFSNRKPKPVPAGLPAWQSRAEWLDNRIRSNAKATLWVAWGFTIFWNAISAPIPFMLPGELARGNQAALIGLLFPLVGLGLLVWAIRRTLNWRRFSVTPLVMDPFPGALGADVGGTVELRLAYSHKHRFRVTLTCNHVYTRRTSDGTETVRDAKWQDEQQADVQPGMRGTRLRFLFQPPDELPESSEGDSSWYEWTVQVSADLAGTDFNRSWEIPVFKDAGRQTAREKIEPRHFEPGSAGLLDKVVQVRETGAGVELYYPYLRNPGVGLSMVLFGVAFVGFAWLFHAVSGKAGPPVFFLGLFVVIGTLVFAGGLYMLGNSLRVTAGTQGVSTVREIFGLRFARYVATDEITRIEKSIGLQSRQGTRTTVYYRVRVHTGDGRKITVGSGIPGASRVDAIIEKIQKALDLPAFSVTENTGSRFEEQPATISQTDAIAGQRRVKGIRQLINVASTVFFFAFVFWQFRDVIFRLL